MNSPSLFIAFVALNLFAYITIRLRPIIFKVKLFKPMIWNFKLSLLPIVILLGTDVLAIIISVISAYTDIIVLRYLAILIFALGMVLWFIMLPNSGYLITELNLTHRNEDSHEVPIWYDIVSVLSFALSGIVNTLISIVILQITFLVGVDPEQLTRSDFVSFIVTAIIINLFVAIGVYFGRQIRFNSWDLLHPKSFFKKLKAHFSNPHVFKEFLLFIVMHTTFFMIMYYALGIPYMFKMT
ncbi:DUF1361 domain-containing protein [Erysipelothrix sp. HDW6C]|uniref:DUF1361 domain-containing protein n=1 Tax=Erysipelothrix sp. HDW6C TaxID=2714930 RepID=UPI00140B6054|nr:DUF1361 domain-containing protein [Erysipelothrix sp. HDW6C]QIK69340.1 DUF1361 domain-containing protein [Erysipelothrix sp. HDW6C]